MSRYLIKTTDTYRIDTIGEVEQFHNELKHNTCFELESFSYQNKQVKQRGEIIDEYVLVTVKKVFNDAKDPVSNIDIIYETNE
ncbi:MAG: hypothetical protein HUJ68_14075 [Clostridia bacterium]|nr:hypothetical protein [Clostridia bacterium]